MSDQKPSKYGQIQLNYTDTAKSEIEANAFQQIMSLDGLSKQQAYRSQL